MSAIKFEGPSFDHRLSGERYVTSSQLKLLKDLAGLFKSLEICQGLAGPQLRVVATFRQRGE